MRRIETHNDGQQATASIGWYADRNDWERIAGQLALEDRPQPNASVYTRGGLATLSCPAVKVEAEIGMTDRVTTSCRIVCERETVVVSVDPVSKRVTIDVVCDEERYHYDLAHGQLREAEK